MKMFCNVGVFSWCEQPWPQMGQQQNAAQAQLQHPALIPRGRGSAGVTHTWATGAQRCLCAVNRVLGSVLGLRYCVSCSSCHPFCLYPVLSPAWRRFPHILLCLSLYSTSSPGYLHDTELRLFWCLLDCPHTLSPSFSCLPIPVKYHSHLLSGYWVLRPACLWQLTPKTAPSVEGKDLESK